MILTVSAHPDATSFSTSLAHSYVDSARQAGASVDLIDLASASFDPVLRYGYHQHMAPDAFVEDSIAKLTQASRLTLVFPVWWAAEPSVLKGWFDRVLTPGVAYRYRPNKATPERLMQGKKATLIVTSHAPAWYVRHNPRYPVARLKKDVLGYCGIKVTDVLALGGMDGARDTFQARAAFIDEVCGVGASDAMHA